MCVCIARGGGYVGGHRMRERELRRLGAFGEQDGTRLRQILLRQIAESQQRIGMCQELRRARVIPRIADDLPEVHGRVGGLQHFLVFFGRARQGFRQRPGPVVGLACEAPLPDGRLFGGRRFAHDA